MINKIQLHTQKKLDKFWVEVTIKNLLLGVLSILITRVPLFDGLYPFGLAFLAALSIKHKPLAVPYMGIVFGFLSLNLGDYIFKYLTSATLFLLIVVFLESREISKSPLLIGSIIFGTSLLTGSVYVALTEPLVFDYILNFFESSLVVVLSLLFTYAVPFSLQEMSRDMNWEKVIATTIIVVTALTGIANLTVLGLSLQNILLALIIMILATWGFGISTSGATIIGVVYSFVSTFEPFVVGVFSFGGLLAGIFKELGKLGIILGFALGVSIMNFYMNGYAQVVLSLKEILAASFVFLLIPNSILSKYQSNLTHLDGAASSQPGELSNLMVYKLKEYSGILEELAASFRRVAKHDQDSILDNSGLMQIYDGIVENVCSDCHNYKRCWEKDFYKTYRAFLDIFSEAEENEDMLLKDLPQSLKNKCTKRQQLLNMINFMINSQKINTYWQKKVIESKNLVAEQLEGMAKIVRGLSSSFNSDIKKRPDIENRIRNKLDKKGIEADIAVVESEANRVEVYIDKKPCKGDKECITQIVPAVSHVLGKKVVIKNSSCGLKRGGIQCSLKLMPAQAFQVAIGTASVSKEVKKSGDTLAFKELNNGNYMLAISDGMGTGEKAAIESNDTISLLEHLLEGGCDKEVAIKTINSTLSLRSSEETFSTIDLALIDLYNAQVDFVKIGSAPSFIKSRKDVRVIKKSSLPVGILDEVDVNQVSVKLNHGDFVIMVSDGVLENNPSIKDPITWLKQLIENKQTKNPQEMADYILKEAGHNKQPRDDMTVLVAKIWKRI